MGMGMGGWGGNEREGEGEAEGGVWEKSGVAERGGRGRGEIIIT
jgi:hypothetical protein